MARQKIVRTGEINIVLHPHSPDLYVSLFTEAHALKLRGVINKNRRSRIGFLESFKAPNGSSLVNGSLFFYTALDTSEAWLDDAENTIASEAQLKSVKEALKSLHPEFRSMRFILDPSVHRIYFENRNEEGKSFAPKIVQKALSSIFSSPIIREKFGEVEITVIPKEDALDAIINMDQLKKLIIDLRPPNPDDWGDEAAELEQELEAMNAKRLEKTLTRRDDAETLIPDEYTMKLARVAQINGKVIGRGISKGETVEESTVSHPKIESYKLDSDTTPLEAFKNFVFGIIERR